jgi:hypothetical protein
MIDLAADSQWRPAIADHYPLHRRFQRHDQATLPLLTSTCVFAQPIAA